MEYRGLCRIVDLILGSSGEEGLFTFFINIYFGTLKNSLLMENEVRIFESSISRNSGCDTTYSKIGNNKIKKK